MGVTENGIDALKVVVLKGDNNEMIINASIYVTSDSVGIEMC